MYIRDSGLLHSLLEIFDRDRLRRASAFGLSWESFVIENLLAVAPQGTRSYFYRTYAGAEIDLILEHRKLGRWAIEIKYGAVESMGRGFHEARKDLKPDRAFAVHSGSGALHDRRWHRSSWPAGDGGTAGGDSLRLLRHHGRTEKFGACENNGMPTITAEELQAACLQVLEQVQATGEPVRVTLRGKPLAEIAPPAEE